MSNAPKLQELKDRFDRGDPLAAGDCLAAAGEHAPPWAFKWFQEAWHAYRSGAALSLRDALLGSPPLDGGRHANPRRKELDHQLYESAHAAVRAAVHCGCHGLERFEVGARVFTSMHPNEPLTDSRIKKIYEPQNARVNKGQYTSFLTPPLENVITCSGYYAEQLERGGRSR